MKRLDVSALRVVKDMMRDDPDFVSYLKANTVLKDAIQTTQKRISLENENNFRHVMLRYIHIRMIRAVLSVLNDDPNAMVEFSFRNGMIVQMTAQLEGRLKIWDVEVRRRDNIQRKSSHWTEEGFVRDLVRILIHHFPNSVSVYRSVANMTGSRPYQFIRFVDDVLEPAGSNRKWFRLYNQEII